MPISIERVLKEHLISNVKQSVKIKEMEGKMKNEETKR